MGVQMTTAVVAEGLCKRFGQTVALDGVDLTVPAGTVLGLLGPNGAGKTTAVRVLTTLLRPDAGRAWVAGADVLADPAAVRQRIGLAGQYAAVDENLTGRENLRMVGLLYHLGRKRSARRADELLERFELTDAGNRLARTYSGGMRRRLDLAASLVNDPPVLFLDEPTTGLDPRSRLVLWEMIEELVSDGTTLLLTTQYLEEADRLADRIAVIDQGRVIAEGTSDELKDRVGGAVVEARVAEKDLQLATETLVRLDHTPLRADDRLSVPASGAGDVATVARAFEEAGIVTIELALHRPTLDDVFLNLTGHVADATGQDRAGGAAGDVADASAGAPATLPAGAPNGAEGRGPA